MMFTCNMPQWRVDTREWHEGEQHYVGTCARFFMHRGACSTDQQRPTLNRFVALLAFTAILLSALTWINVQRADADTGSKQLPVQPYGGCDEAWQAPHSLGAQDCRRLGWVVRPHLLVDPHGVVRWSRLPHCTFEDASNGPIPCSWNFGHGIDGYGGGLSYWVTGTYQKNRAHYVWTHGPRNGWGWVTHEMADVLAEGDNSAPLHSDFRDWQQCKSYAGVHRWTIRCADGAHVRI